MSVRAGRKLVSTHELSNHFSCILIFFCLGTIEKMTRISYPCSSSKNTATWRECSICIRERVRGRRRRRKMFLTIGWRYCRQDAYRADYRRFTRINRYRFYRFNGRRGHTCSRGKYERHEEIVETRKFRKEHETWQQ